MKKRNVFKRIEAKRHLIPVLLVIAVLLSGMCVLPGCSLKGINNTKKEEIDYTVVEDEDLPAELKKLIDEKKGSTLKMTYTTKDYTYMVAGYGTMTTSGYSISVNDVYLGENSIYVGFKPCWSKNSGTGHTESHNTIYSFKDRKA